ncbi:helix-turn-helix transcriptional regulator [Caproiciproducens galactitolivorans]|uniref:HTH-type transcriptional activator HxlR n=1 Tax=Caproiciproducens galactitolivorans TaxID=642589 RepID=A0A4Z0YDW3_9FIRM|nr:helix-turn-helix domain-containing protein [Caproiciproducens galactitolivorans]QEY35315.1 helix-turn-helix transcriptional regulator [Caproiciproducens galactitolivorans]TGJ77013.1 HTH-type transcriptional activator HxlR [Caproiciproducens galactitolivorans]
MKKDKEKKKKREKKVQQVAAQAERALFPKDASSEPLEYALSIVGGKWKIRILWALRGGEDLRYGAIKQQIPSITDMMLSQSLRELTASGMIVRRQFQQIPPKVEYRITQNGLDLIPSLEQMYEWGLRQMKEE